MTGKLKIDDDADIVIKIKGFDYKHYMGFVEGMIRSAKFMLSAVTEDGNQSRMEIYQDEVDTWTEMHDRLINNMEMINHV